MVNKIGIRNFKSIDTLDLELGRFNVIIGANGSGKSNVLEAIAMMGAAAVKKLDNEFLVPRGIRVAKANHMRSAFDARNSALPIVLSCEQGDFPVEWIINNENEPFSSWTTVGPAIRPVVEWIEHLITDKPLVSKQALELSEAVLHEKPEIASIFDSLRGMIGSDPGMLEFAKTTIYQVVHNLLPKELQEDLFRHLGNFLIYSPDFDTLRNFKEEGQIEPMGKKGEGLFNLLRNLCEQQPELLLNIQRNLSLFEWYQGLSVPSNALSGDRYIEIDDRFLSKEIDQLDQRSANEGFLFVLFYLALFMSEYTPKFFAIDNIETALNPKLATELMVRLNKLSKDHGKQVIMTTHSPAVLDGLDLNDPEQRLFVAYRNIDGRTRLRRVEPPKDTEVSLSQAFMRNYFGGLPDNF